MPRVDQAHAPQDEGAHDDLGQLGVGLHQRAQLRLADGEHLARLDHADARKPGQPAQRGDLAGEVARHRARVSERSPSAPGMKISSLPESTTSMLRWLSPGSTRVSPARVFSRWPRASRRASWRASRRGNICSRRFSKTSFDISVPEEMQVQPRLGMGRIEQERGLVLPPRLRAAPGELVSVPEVVVPARIPWRQRDAGLPQCDFAAVVELAHDAGGGEDSDHCCERHYGKVA